MPVFIRCPDCQKLLKVKEELAGKKVKCPNCSKPVRVPAAEPEVVGVEEVIDLPREASAAPSQDIPVSAAEMVLPDQSSREVVRPVVGSNRKVTEPAGAPPQRRERDTRYPAESSSVQRVPFPAVVRVAGSIWIFFGVIVLLTTLALAAITVLALASPPTTSPPPPTQAGRPTPNPSTATSAAAQPNVCSFACFGFIFLFGAVFLFVGLQTVRGTAAGTIGNGIGSLLFGLIFGSFGAQLLLAGVVGSMGNVATPGLEAGSWLALFFGGVYALAGGLLLLAGLLALVGYGQYTAWRKAERAARE